MLASATTPFAVPFCSRELEEASVFSTPPSLMKKQNAKLGHLKLKALREMETSPSVD
jgi:hypothetical protein